MSTNAKSRATPWPPVPFTAPLGLGSGRLVFDNLGAYGNREQRQAFDQVMSTLRLCLQGSWSITSAKLVFVVPDDETKGIESFFFQLELKPVGTSPVPRGYLLSVLRKVASVVRLHEMRELTANLQDDPGVKGGFGMDLEPPLPIPRGSYPTFIAVTSAPDMLIELSFTGKPYDLEDHDIIFQLFDKALTGIATSQGDFRQTVAIDNDGATQYVLTLSANPPTGQGHSTFTATKATEVLDSLLSFLVDFDTGDLRFDVLQTLNRRVDRVGRGTLIQRRSSNNMTLSRTGDSKLAADTEVTAEKSLMKVTKW